MEIDDLWTSMHKTLSLKHFLFSTFDTEPLGLSINKTQERVLMIAWRHEKATMLFLSREAGLEKGSLTTVIDSLEALALVRRERQDDDKRSFIVRLTPEGSTLAARIDSLFRIHLRNLLTALTAEENAEFAEAMKSLARLIPKLTKPGALSCNPTIPE